MESKKYYTNSKGEKVDVSTLETTHLKNAMAQKMESLFYAENKDDFSKRLEEVNNLKNEYFKRINKKYEELKD